jgi:glycosyltransferase involved in cell wall biosynthesis
VNVTLAGGFSIDTGREAMHVYLAMGMRRAGARVSLHATHLNLRGCPPEFVRIYAQSSPHIESPVVHAGWSGGDLSCYAKTQLFLRAMYEASSLPAAWPQAINQARGVIVPSRFVAAAFRSAGVSVPVHVIPDGVDPQTYQYAPADQHEGMTTLVVAALWDPSTIYDRKHVPAAIRAWQLAFEADPAARLILKLRRPDGCDYPLLRDRSIACDPRITITAGVEQACGIAHWYEQADVVLALGSEGFGLPLIEAMAVGRPVIALASEGQRDVCDEAGDLVIAIRPAGFEPHYHYGRERCGVRGYPSVEDVAARLRWVAEHRAEAADMGRAASQWVARNRNVWDYGPSVLRVLKESCR